MVSCIWACIPPQFIYCMLRIRVRTRKRTGTGAYLSIIQKIMLVGTISIGIRIARLWRTLDSATDRLFSTTIRNEVKPFPHYKLQQQSASKMHWQLPIILCNHSREINSSILTKPHMCNAHCFMIVNIECVPSFFFFFTCWELIIFAIYRSWGQERELGLTLSLVLFPEEKILGSIEL